MRKTRKCWVCHSELPLNHKHFYRDWHDSVGFQKMCRSCNKLKNAEYNRSRREYIKRKNKARYETTLRLDPDFNKRRYAQNKEAYKRRRRQQLSTVAGWVYGLYSAARDRATGRRMRFSITLEDVETLFSQQENQCALTGIPFTFIHHQSGNRRRYNPWNPSLDRIDSDKGYTKGNVRLVAVCVNLALNWYGETVFERMCRAYLDNLKNRKHTG